MIIKPVVYFVILLFWLDINWLFCGETESKPVTKKLICWPAIEPTPATLLQDLSRTKELPFAGYVIRVVDHKGRQLMWEMWGNEKFDKQDFSQAEAQLKELHQQYQGEIFLRMNVTPGEIDWFDDQAWQKILHNTKLLAELARSGSCTGFMFDTEQYVHQPFNYNLQPQKQHYSQAQFSRLIQQRGSSLIKTIQAEVNSPVIILTFGYYAALPHTGDGRKGINYELLAPLLDGMLSSLNPQAQMIDGWEYSYDYKMEQDFIDAKKKLNSAIENVSTLTQPGFNLQKNYIHSFGLWVDYQDETHVWDTSDFSQNYFTPAEFKNSLILAQKHSSRYIWIYSQKPNWFTKQDLPEAYLKALFESQQPK